MYFNPARFFLVLFFLTVSLAVSAQCPPVLPVAQGQESCIPQSFTLTASNSPDSYHWYDAAAGGNLLAEGPVFHTPVLSASYTFYVCSFNSALNCESSRIPVQAVLLPNAGEPSVYGFNQWNVYCFNGTDWSDYKGFYVDTNFNIDTPLLWSPSESPSNAAMQAYGYIGCEVTNDFHSVAYKRHGFPNGIYRISISDHHDDFELSVNGKLIMRRVGNGQSYASTWTGPLNDTSEIAYQWVNYTGNSSATVNFILISPPSDLYAGQIKAPPHFCESADPQALEDSITIAADRSAYVKSGITPFSFPPPDKLFTYSKSPDSIYYSFLSFDISFVKKETFHNAYLYLRTYERTTYPNRLLYASAVDTNWNENLFWGNQPIVSSAPLKSEVIYDLHEQWYALDLSIYLLSQLQAGNQRVAFLISDSASTNGPLVLYSRHTLSPPLLVINKKRGGCSDHVFQWQVDYDCQNNWSDIPNANGLSYDPPGGIKSKTCFRLRVGDACGNVAFSDAVSIDIDPATQSGTLHVTETSPTRGTLEVSSHVGNILHWEVSENNFDQVKDTINRTQATLDYQASSVHDLYYRALVRSGACAYAYTDTVLIAKVKDFQIFNSFSPNGDGINEAWAIEGIERYPDNTVVVVNTMGVTVYEGKNYDNVNTVWDGRHNGSPLPDGTYYYSVQLADQPVITGYVVIKR